MWVKGKNIDLAHKLSEDEIDLLNSRMSDCSKHFPVEFNRKGRFVTDFHHWTAVEFRTFLLYSGVIVLKDVLTEEKYNHFLLLHVAFQILLDPKCTVQQINYAGRCLVKFVYQFQEIYGDHHIVYNVHNLLHIAEDCLHFNCSLEHFNCFPFENHLGKLKRMLKGTRRPLAQLYKRISEIESCRYVDNVIGMPSHIKCNSKVDSFYQISSGCIVKIVRVGKHNFRAIPLSLSQTTLGYTQFYSHPVKASDLGIYVYTNLEEAVDYPIESLERAVKCVSLPFVKSDYGDDETQFLLLPLLHQRV